MVKSFTAKSVIFMSLGNYRVYGMVYCGDVSDFLMVFM